MGKKKNKVKIVSREFNSNHGMNDVYDKFNRLFEEYERTGEVPSAQDFHDDMYDDNNDGMSLMDEIASGFGYDTEGDDKSDDYLDYLYTVRPSSAATNTSKAITSDSEVSSDCLKIQKLQAEISHLQAELAAKEEGSDEPAEAADPLAQYYVNPFEFIPNLAMVNIKGYYRNAESVLIQKAIVQVEDDTLKRLNVSMSDEEFKLLTSNIRTELLITSSPLCVVDHDYMIQLAQKKYMPKNLIIYTYHTADSDYPFYGLYLLNREAFKSNWNFFMKHLSTVDMDDQLTVLLAITDTMDSEMYSFVPEDDVVLYTEESGSFCKASTMIANTIMQLCDNYGPSMVANGSRTLDEYLKTASEEYRLFEGGQDVIYGQIVDSILPPNHNPISDIYGEDADDDYEDDQDDDEDESDEEDEQANRNWGNVDIPLETVEEAETVEPEEDIPQVPSDHYIPEEPNEATTPDVDIAYVDDESNITSSMSEAMKKAGLDTKGTGDMKDGEFIFKPHMKTR